MGGGEIVAGGGGKSPWRSLEFFLLKLSHSQLVLDACVFSAKWGGGLGRDGDLKESFLEGKRGRAEGRDDGWRAGTGLSRLWPSINPCFVKRAGGRTDGRTAAFL